MAELTPPVGPQQRSANQPAPDDLRLQGAKEQTQTTLMLRAALDGIQQALQHAKEQSAERTKETKEIFDQ